MNETRAEASLGQFIGRYRGSFSQGGHAWLLGLVLLPGALGGPVGLVRWLASDGFEFSDPSAWGHVCGWVIVTLVGPLILALPLMRWLQWVTVFDDGLVHRSVFGTTIVRAEELSRVDHTIHRRKTSSCSEVWLIRRGKRGHLIMGLADAEAFVRLVRGWVGGPAPSHGAPAGAWVPPGNRS